MMDDRTEPNRITMADNGFGYKVNIPAVFIKKEDGEILKELFSSLKGVEDV